MGSKHKKSRTFVESPATPKNQLKTIFFILHPYLKGHIYHLVNANITLNFLNLQKNAGLKYSPANPKKPIENNLL